MNEPNTSDFYKKEKRSFILFKIQNDDFKIIKSIWRFKLIFSRFKVFEVF
jgi:hypothetical protein